MRSCVLLVLACTILAPVTDAAVTNTKLIRGSLTADQHLAYNLATRAAQTPPEGTSWTTIGIGAGVVVLVAGGAAAFFLMKKKPEDADKSAEDGGKVDAVPNEDEIKTLEPDVEKKPAEPSAGSKAAGFGEMAKLLAQKVAQDAGPKLSKAGAVRNVLNHRLDSFQHKAKNFMFNELSGTAGAILKEMQAEEAMLLLDWNTAVESNFPPMSILLAGVMSPSVLTVMAGHHLLQAVTVGLPMFCLCVAAIYVDWGVVCSIPTLDAWLYTQTVLAFLMFFGHFIMLLTINSGKKKLDEKSKEVGVKMSQSKEGSLDSIREQCLGNLVILQEALLIENGIRHSIWNMVVGLATIAWIFTTFWNLTLIIGWTFVPGVTAFHPAAAEAAGGEYCGAWMSVIVLRVSMLLSVLYLFMNMFTVVQFLCDMMINNQGFAQSVLEQARTIDSNGTGLPVVEILAKAFLLRGNAETLNSRLSVVENQKASAESEKAALEAKLKALDSQIEYAQTAESSLKEQLNNASGEAAAQTAGTEKLANLQGEVKESRNTMAETIQKITEWENKLLTASAEEKEILEKELEEMKELIAKVMQEAEKKAIEIKAATAEALEELWEKIQEEIEYVKNTETFKAMKAKAEMAYDKLTDPAFHQELMDMASQGVEKAKELAMEAKDMIEDPELIDKANAALAKAKEKAAELAEAAQDPELYAKLQEAAQQAYEEAQAEAKKVADAVKDPELQKKLQDAQDQALAQVETVRKAAVEVANDPEIQKKLKETGMA
jgi:hypothetical protein